MVKLGNFLFHYRNFLFPIFYIFLFIPSPLLFDNIWIAIVAGLIIALTGQAIRVATVGLVYIIRGGKNRQIYAEGLVTEGIFSHCRNPLYVGNVLIIAGLGIMSDSLFFILVMIPLFIFFYQAIIRAEENFLYNKFGAAFTDYTSRVNRWLPGMRGIAATLSSMQFHWKRVFIKEYTSAFIWMVGGVLLIMNNTWQYDRTHFYILRSLLIVKLVLLVCFYLGVRYMKKSKRWTD
jgi:protein-S-isoprenylcysteine O-methyltransferase Ste14